MRRQVLGPAGSRIYWLIRRLMRGGHSLLDVTLSATSPVPADVLALAGDCAELTIRNVVPAPFLAPRFAAAHASVLFSALVTLMIVFGRFVPVNCESNVTISPLIPDCEVAHSSVREVIN